MNEILRISNIDDKNVAENSDVPHKSLEACIQKANENIDDALKCIEKEVTSLKIT